MMRGAEIVGVEQACFRGKSLLLVSRFSGSRSRSVVPTRGPLASAGLLIRTSETIGVGKDWFNGISPVGMSYTCAALVI